MDTIFSFEAQWNGDVVEVFMTDAGGTTRISRRAATDHDEAISAAASAIKQQFDEMGA